MDLITVDEAIRSNDIVIGIAVLALVLIAAAMWLFTVTYTKKTAKRINRLVAETEKRVRKECEKEAHQNGVKMFERWAKTRAELAKAQHELEEARNCFTALQGDYNRLVETAKDCPAYGTVSKRGQF